MSRYDFDVRVFDVWLYVIYVDLMQAAVYLAIMIKRNTCKLEYALLNNIKRSSYLTQIINICTFCIIVLIIITMRNS